jgi:preprotein translocase subunit SecD
MPACRASACYTARHCDSSKIFFGGPAKFTLLLGFALACFADDAKAKAGPVTLTYEMEKLEGTAGKGVNIKDELAAVSHRIKVAHLADVEMNPTNESQFQIVIRNGSAEQIGQIKQLLSGQNNVELRIVADKRPDSDSKLVAAARKESHIHVWGVNHELVGKWVRLGSDVASLKSDNHLIRKNKKGDDEILLAIDGFNVTAQHLKTAYSKEVDDGYAVHFELDEQGAKSLGKLTEANLPDPATGTARDLAIVIDDYLIDAFAIRSKITGRGQIAGHLTREQADLVADALRAGKLSIPANLRLVSETAK